MTAVYITPPQGYEDQLIEYCENIFGNDITFHISIYDAINWKPSSILYSFEHEDFPVRWNDIAKNVIERRIKLNNIEAHSDLCMAQV